MNHDKYKELLQLYVLNELNKTDKVDIENHIAECTECNEELQKFNLLNNLIQNNSPDEPGDHLIYQSRDALFNKINKNISSSEEKTGLTDKIKNWIFSGYGYAVNAATLLVIGFFIGTAGNPPLTVGSDIDIDQIRNSESSIKNVRLLKMPDENGNIEFTFESVRPVKYQSNASDEIASILLAKALLNSDNPGVRIKSVNTIANQSKKQKMIDPIVKKSLIDALKTDGNVAVRSTALEVLAKYPIDEDIKNALIDVLTTDKNSRLRIMAINTLGENKSSIDNKMIEVLNKKAKTDENNYIRLKAANIVQEGEIK